MNDSFMLRQAQHERIGVCSRITFPFALSLSKGQMGMRYAGGTL